ncbi:TonB-dependent receptor [Fulvimarina sp. MAC8]|uniref:TonB-dependent receptor n=1 Tax=Fulvimarina sp. MAC8 TaxID=3162874 RepID=UPI0032EDBF97
MISGHVAGGSIGRDTGMRRRRLALLASTVLVLGTAPALAQSETEIIDLGGIPLPGTIQLDEVVVYGSRETDTLEGSTASVGIVSSAAIEDGQIQTVQDSFRRLGNVNDPAFTNSGFVIRGINSEGFTPASAPMGSLYVDGVLQTRYGARFGARNMWDTEQVEVYRGPQSTLSGRAATAGSIYIKTKDPTFDQEVILSGTVGNRDMGGVAFVANTPLVPGEAALRVSGSFDRQETDISYPTYEVFSLYDDFKTDVSGNLRAKLLLTPSTMPDTQALLSYSYSYDRPNEGLIFENSDYTLEDRRGDGYSIFGILLPTLAEFRSIKVHNAGLEVTHNISDALKFTSQSGFTYGTTERLSVDAKEPGPDGLQGEVDDYLVSQELRLNYDLDRWSWVVGAFGSFQKFDSDFSLVSTPYFTNYDEYFVRETTNVAAFGEATYEFIPTWFLTAGGRLDYLEESTDEGIDNLEFGVPNVFNAPHVSYDEVNFVPKLGISKDLTENHRVGFVYTEGFRSGGYYLDRENSRVGTYDAESARNYELFYKGHMLDDSLTLNANLFYTQYNDQQIEVRPDVNRPSYTITENAAKSRSWGFEIEPTYNFSEQFSLFASVGYLDTKFEEFDSTVLGDLVGESFPDAPEWSVAFGGRYNFVNGIFVGGDAKYTSSYNAAFGENDLDTIDSRILVNAQVGLKQENWEFTAFAENLLDEEYLTFVDLDASEVVAQAGKPRSFGFNLKTKF